MQDGSSGPVRPVGGRSGQGIASVLRHLQDAPPVDSALRIATSEMGDADLGTVIPALLKAIRSGLGMDVAFVSQFIDDRRLFQFVDAAADRPVISAGQSEALEKSWCAKVVEGRLPRFVPDAELHVGNGDVPRPPFPIGTHLSVPIQLASGRVLGTVCCFSFGRSERVTAADLSVLESVAELIAAAEHKRLTGG